MMTQYERMVRSEPQLSGLIQIIPNPDMDHFYSTVKYFIINKISSIDLSLVELLKINDALSSYLKRYLDGEFLLIFNNMNEVYKIILSDFIRYYEDVMVVGGYDVYLISVDSSVMISVTHEEIVSIHEVGKALQN